MSKVDPAYLGDPKTPDKETNCGTCSLRQHCRDPHKSRRYACSFWMLEAQKGDDPSAIQFQEWMRDLVHKETVLADPYAIDDRDAPLAPNFYTWCMSPKFLHHEPIPFPWQLQVGMKLYGDGCPYCSDRDWYDDIPFDCDPNDIPTKIVLRTNGRCPRCGKTILHGIRDKLENDVDTFIGVVGQRCVTGNTLMLTDRGIVRIGDYAPASEKTGWVGGDFHVRTPLHWRTKGRRATLHPVLESGSIVKATNFWVSQPEYVRKVTLRGGMYVEGTDDHPIKTMHGWCTLKNIKVGDYVPLHVGQNVWGNCNRVSSLDEARTMGFWVAEGSGNERWFHVTNYDHRVLRVCRDAMLRVNSKAHIRIRNREGTDDVRLKRCVGTNDDLVYAHFDSLLEGLWRKSADKHIPRAILEAPRDVVCAFLQALFEGDGCCYKSTVEYSSLSCELVHQLQVVMANIGIVTSQRKRMSWAKNGSVNQVSKPVWSLLVRGPMLRKFKDAIGFFSERKRATLDVAISCVENGEDQPYWYDRYPESVKQEYLDLVHNIDAEWAKVFTPFKSSNRVCVNTNFRYNVEDWQRLASSNVCLSRSRLQRYWNKLRRLPQWRDLSLDLRNRLWSFHDLHLDPTLVWVEVVSNHRSTTKHTTYDVHVPGHHRFMANGLLNHNSGKCVDGATLVPTKRGVLQIRHVKVGDYVLVENKKHPVTAIHKQYKKPTIILRTHSGYSLRLTPEHKVWTPEGWCSAGKARSVQIRTEHVARMSGIQWLKERRTKCEKEHEVVDRLCRAPVDVAPSLIRAQIEIEATAQERLVLYTRPGMGFAVQQALLAWGIFCMRKEKSDALLIEQPFAYKYLKQIGIRNRQVAYHIYQARGIFNKNASRGACNHIVLLIAQQNLHKMVGNPALLNRAQEVHAMAIRGVLTCERAGQAIGIFQQLPAFDRFLRNMLIDALKDIAYSRVYWDDVESKTTSVKIDVHDITVDGLSANGAHRFVANGILIHNSTGSSMPLTYSTHMALKLKNPSGFYGIKRNQLLTTTVVGIDFGNARTNVFNPFMESVTNSPWFELYHEILNDAAKRRGDSPYYKQREVFLSYRHAALYYAPSSPSRRALRGKTRYGMVLDEMGQFSEKKQLVNISGLSVWDALQNSLQTVRGACWDLRKKGIVSIPPSIAIGISSPWDVADPIMVKRKQLLGNKKAYIMLKETWNANPKLPFELLDAEYPDKVVLWRDFGCRPPLSANPFIAGIDPVWALIDRYLPLGKQTTIIESTRRGQKRFTTLRMKWRGIETDTPKLLSFDAGRVNNAFGICIAHRDENGYIVYDLFAEIHGRQDLPVSFEAAIQNVIIPAILRYNVCVITSDRWQNYATADRLETNHNVSAYEKKLSYGDFEAWRDDLLHGRMSIPRPELPKDEILGRAEEDGLSDMPTSHFIRQCVRVVDVPGKTVEKPTVGNDDIFRAAVVAHATMAMPEVAEKLIPGRLKRRGEGPVGAVSFGTNTLSSPQSSVGVVSTGFIGYRR